MIEKEQIFKPSIEQLTTDIKKEALIALLFTCFGALVLLLTTPYAKPFLLFLFLLLVYPYRFFKFKKSIEDRYIKILNNQVTQENPDLPRGMRNLNLTNYKKAKLRSNDILLIDKQGISLGEHIDLKGYSEKQLIFSTIENIIKNHNETSSTNG